MIAAIKSFLLIDLINQSDHLNPHMKAEMMIDLRPSLKPYLVKCLYNLYFIYLAMRQVFHLMYFLPTWIYFGWTQKIICFVLLLCVQSSAFQGSSISLGSTSDSLAQNLCWQLLSRVLKVKCWRMVKMSEKLREKKKVRNFPRNENAYFREIEGGKNMWINWGRRKRWEFCYVWEQNKQGKYDFMGKEENKESVCR